MTVCKIVTVTLVAVTVIVVVTVTVTVIQSMWSNCYIVSGP